MADVLAHHEGVGGVHFVHQVVLLQKVKRAVDGGGRDSTVARLHVVLQVIGLGTTAATQQQLQHFSALGGELGAPLGTVGAGPVQALLQRGFGQGGGGSHGASDLSAPRAQPCCADEVAWRGLSTIAKAPQPMRASTTVGPLGKSAIHESASPSA